MIHIQLLFEKKNEYFTSKIAVFDYMTPQQIGITKEALLHKTGDTIVTQRAVIRIRKPLGRKKHEKSM